MWCVCDVLVERAAAAAEAAGGRALGAARMSVHPSSNSMCGARGCRHQLALLRQALTRCRVGCQHGSAAVAVLHKTWVGSSGAGLQAVVGNSKELEREHVFLMC